MTLANIAVYVALIVFLLYRKVIGQPLTAPKKLFALPILVTIIGYGDISHAGMKPAEITLTAIGAALSLGLGLVRGGTDKLSVKDGSPFVRWGVVSLTLFVANLVAKLVLDLIGVAMGGTTSEVGKSLVFTLGLTLLGEAAVLWMRSGSPGLSGPQRTESLHLSRPYAAHPGVRSRRRAVVPRFAAAGDDAAWPRVPVCLL
jgi:hypothetical protein